jgi:DNA-binding response OmpR family regulator
MVLSKAGFECISYTDSVKALQEFKPNYYDLILLDNKMPVLDGFELCKKVIARDRTVQVLFITAADQFYENKEESCLEPSNHNNINYLQKPIGNKELIHIVNTTLAARDTK